MQVCTAESCWDPEARAAGRHSESWVDFYPPRETQMRRQTTVHTFHAEGRGGCGKPDFWPVPQETH